MMGLSFAGVTLLLAGCSSGLAAPALTGPPEVSGPLGRSVSVMCDYQKQYQYHEKYWCRGAVWSSCKIVIQSTGADAKSKRDRISLTDNRKLCSFTVTMENLTLADAGTYWCGISKVGRDYGVSVKVTVLQGLSTPAMVTNGSLATANSTVMPTRHPESSPFSMLMVLFPVILLILVLLLSGAIGLAKRLMLKRKRGAGAGGATTVSNEAVASPEGDVIYAVAKPKPRKCITTASSPASALSEHSPERVEDSNVAPGRTADIFYATLKSPVLDEQAIYTNMDRTSNQPWDPTVYCELKEK